MIADVPPVVSPVPWGLFVVLSMGAFSAMVWGLSTLFRPRPSFARGPEEDESIDDPGGPRDVKG